MTVALNQQIAERALCAEDDKRQEASDRAVAVVKKRSVEVGWYSPDDRSTTTRFSTIRTFSH
jgi:hypothetical protein